MSPLAKFADELEALAGAIDRYRFGGPERYVVDVDALRRKLRNLVDRMRREASVAPVERLPLAVGRRAVMSGGREVTVEHRRRRLRA